MGKYKRKFLVLFLAVHSVFVFAQTNEIDSTAKAITSEKNDTLRFRKLVRLVQEIDELNQGTLAAKAAIPFLAKELDQAVLMKNTWWEARLNQALATLYFVARNDFKAQEFALKAQKEWERTSNFTGQAEIKYLEGKILIVNGSIERIVKLWDEAVAICRKYKLKSLEAKITGFEATFFLYKGDNKKAAQMFENWLRIPNQSELLTAYYYTNLATAYKNLKRFQEADSCAELALKMAKKQGLTSLAATIIFNKACVAYDLGRYDESEKLALESKPLILKGDALAYKVNMYGLLMDIYKAKKNYEKAFYYSEKYAKHHDSLNEIDKQTAFKELDKKYQTDLKNKTIAEQEGKIAQEQKEKNYLLGGIASLAIISVLGGFLFYVIRKRKESQLNQNLAESEMKALRAQMNPHFMFNSLNAIQQMVMNNENDNAFKYLGTYSKLTRQILENSEKKWITVKDEMKFLELYLQIESLRFEHAFRYKIEVTDEVMPNTDKIPAMIVQPIVENAIKHGLLSKPGEKNLLIRFDRKDETGPLEVTVEDNGLGRAATLSLKKDTDHNSMSLGITENRLQLLDNQGGSKMVVEDLRNVDGSPSGTRVHLLITQPA